jgi:GDP-L-fucose synthase
MQVDANDRILITGATGFLGSHLRPVLQSRYPQTQITGVCSRDYDLLDRPEVEAMFAKLTPTIVVHLAAYSGGIEANRMFPADFFHRNLLLMENVFHACATRRIRKLIYPMGGCSYPNTAVSPIDESQMWNGYPVGTSAGYSMAKKMGLVAAEAYRQQHGLNSIVLVPGNMYGEYDNYHPRDSHVIPGLIRRFYEAKIHNKPSVTVWGTGKPTRDFVYAGDVAKVFPFFIENDAEKGPVNISSGTTTRISELTALIAELIGYQGQLVWDTSKPDGQIHKIFGVEKLRSLGLSCDTPLREGLRRTIDWFVANVDKPGAVRL